MTPDPRILQRKQRWIDFYDLTRPSPNLTLLHWTPGLGPRPWPRMDLVDERIEWAWRKYQIQMDVLDTVEDDTLPYLDVYTGTEIFAAAFGCPVQYPEDDMPFALPLVHSAEEAERLPVPGLDAPPLAVLFDIANELRRRAGPEALLHMVDIQSPMDVAALIWDKLTFYPALVEQPEAVAALAGKVRQLMTAFLDAWFARYGREFIAHYPDYYMPYGITLSEDEVGVVSPALFERLFLPELVELSERYGAFGMHCCANARHQWQGFKKIPNLRLINLNQPSPVIRESLAYFAGHCAQMPVPQGEGAWTLPAALPPGARVVLDYYPQNQSELEHLLRN